MTSRPKRGFTLIEVVVTTLIFSTVLGLTFALFRWGNDSYKLSMARQGAQTLAARAKVRLKKDLLQTHRDGITITNDTSREMVHLGKTVTRAGICFPALSDWNDPAGFHPTTGLPRWDQYRIYYATMESPGRLIRVGIDPGDDAVAPWTDYSPTLLTDTPPTSGSHIIFSSELVSQVHSFQVSRADRNLHCNLQLVTKAKMEGRERQEVLEILLDIPLWNSPR